MQTKYFENTFMIIRLKYFNDSLNNKEYLKNDISRITFKE